MIIVVRVDVGNPYENEVREFKQALEDSISELGERLLVHPRSVQISEER